MNYVVGMAEAKSKLAELVGQVKYGGKRYILERRGQPMAMLIGVEEYEQLEAQARAGSSGLLAHVSPDVLRRQEVLLERARTLRARFGPPEQRLAQLFADLPAETDEFWLEVLETGDANS